MPDGTQLSGHVPPSKAIALLPRDGRREGKEGGKQEREKEGGKKKERRRYKKEGGGIEGGRLAVRKDTRSWLLSVLSDRMFSPDYQDLLIDPGVLLCRSSWAGEQ